MPQVLIQYEFDRKAIPCDGTPVAFDLFAGKKTAEQGDFRISLARDPVNLKSAGDRFACKVIIEIPNGGLLESTNEFMYLAPERGYVPSFEFTMNPDDVDWTPVLKKNFYISLRNDSAFGRLEMKFNMSYYQSPTGLTMDVTINPSGSRNLEGGPAPPSKSAVHE